MDSEKETAIIALYGKEGVGKTSISAVMVKVLMNDKDARILAIDADPTLGLAAALGIKVNKTVYDIKKEGIEEAIVEKDNLSFLAIGGPKSDGYFCKENNLLKNTIDSLAFNFDYVIIDGGTEFQEINGIIIEKVTHLVLVSDATVKGINIINTINEAANDFMKDQKVGLILNRLRTKKEVYKVNLSKDIPLVSYIIDNNEFQNFRTEGKSMLELPEGDLIQSVRIALSKLNV